jgi:hypothetical protein
MCFHNARRQPILSLMLVRTITGTKTAIMQKHGCRGGVCALDI